MLHDRLHTHIARLSWEITEDFGELRNNWN